MPATPVTFTNRAGQRLFGILHEPQGYSRGGLTVLLLSPGVKMRVGPQRLYVHLTNALLDLGLAVFRFDFHGLGDAEGTLPEAMLRDFYNHIEVGRYIDDTIDAMDWLQRERGCSRFVVSGLCGGAITGLLTGERDSRVAGLLALGITPVLAARSAEASRYMTVGQMEAAKKMYVRRLFSPKAWFRFLTFQVDYRLIGRIVMRQLRRQKPAPAVSPPPESDNANPLFPPAFFKMLSTHRPMLLVFGGADRLHFEYQEKFLDRHGQRLKSMPELVEVHVIEAANHVLSLTQWQRELLDVSERWLRTHFNRDLTIPVPARH